MQFKDFRLITIWVDSYGVDNINLRFYQINSRDSYPSEFLNNLTLDYQPMWF